MKILIGNNDDEKPLLKVSTPHQIDYEIANIIAMEIIRILRELQPEQTKQ